MISPPSRCPFCARNEKSLQNDFFSYLSTPDNRGCRCFFDKSNPPPQAAWNGKICTWNHSKSSSWKAKSFANITYINVEPAVVLLADICDLIQRIKSAQHGCASSCVDEERNLPTRFAFKDQTLELAGNHFTVLVRRNHDAVFSSQAADGSARLDGVMALVGCEHRQVAGQSAWPMFLVSREHFMTGSQEGVQVGDWASRGQNRVTALVSDDFAHFRQNDGLHQNENGRNLVREHVGVGCRCQPFASHRNDVQTAWELVEEVRMSWKNCRH